ncbi:MAG: LytTR family DNA-binding domain-containing protein [Bacteroidales bacterium]|nr:LytTR family DNA-binding domain-containing protein [Bacteroidales bacterium]
MNSIIVDDDKLSCKVISEYVRRTPLVSVAGVFDSAVSARNVLMSRDDIELIFLDIEMPEMDGFDFIGSLERPPSIVMITGNERMALKAYDFDVIDYLVKPVSYSRFVKAVDKVLRYREKANVETGERREIFIKKGSSLVRIKLNDIVVVEALENYVVLHTDSEKFTIHFTMKAIDQQLPSSIFVRVHRSFIVNKTRITMIRDNFLEMGDYKDLKSIPIGKSYRDGLLREINVMIR